MPEWLVVLLGIMATGVPLATSYFVARKYGMLGGGEAQIKLNVTLKELTEAYEDKLALRDQEIAGMRHDMDGCKGRLEAMEEREERWMQEKIELKRELAEVYRRLGMTKRAEDPT